MKKFIQKKYLSLRAFTLVEVLVAMLVLAIGLLGLAGITVVVLRSNTLSQQISEATNIAQNLMETMRQSPINYLDCTGANLVNAGNAATLANCEVLTESGVAGRGNNFLPAVTNANASCALPGLLEGLPRTGGTVENYDWVSGNQVARVASDPGIIPAATAICTLSETNVPGRPYLRYYRTRRTNGTVEPAEFELISVVLWRDRFGKWRHVALRTTETQ